MLSIVNEKVVYKIGVHFDRFQSQKILKPFLYIFGRGEQEYIVYRKQNINVYNQKNSTNDIAFSPIIKNVIYEPCHCFILKTNIEYKLFLIRTQSNIYVVGRGRIIYIEWSL